MSEAFRVSYAPAAYRDLGDIYAYVAFTLREKRTAAGLVRRIQTEILSLSLFPERHAAVDWEPWASLGVRKMPVGHYVVYYQVDLGEKTVLVIRIFYGGRDVAHITRMEPQ